MPLFVADVASMPAEFVCKLCRSPWDPVDALCCVNCEEVYCRGCVEDNAVKQRECACGAPFDPSSDASHFRLAHRAVRNLSDATLLVKCKNFLRGCPWTGPRSELASHTASCSESVIPRPVPVVPAPDDLVCAVCHELLNTPVSLPCCEKLLCSDCTLSSLAAHSQCPMCNARIAADDLQKAPKQIGSQLDAIAVRCPHYTVGCQFEGPLRNFAGHIAACPYELGIPAPTPAAAAATSSAAAAAAPLTVKVMNDVPQIRRTCPDHSTPSSLMTLLHIEAPTLVNLADRKMPLRMCAVIDVSGSMKGEKLRLTIESLLFMINELTARDSFSLVAFDSTIERVMSMRVMNDVNKLYASSLVEKLVDKNCTNLCGGLLEGLACVKECQQQANDEQSADAVLLFTDGQANEGISDPDGIVKALKQATASMKRAPAVYTFGFGADHNATLLQRIAEATQGSYYYIKDSSVLRSSFADCLGGLISIVMSDITVTFSLATGVTLNTLMSKYPSVPHATGATVTIKDMYSAETRDIPIQISIDTAALMNSAASSSPLAEAEPVKWKLSYLSALDQQNHTVELVTRVNVSSEAFTGPVDLYVDEQRNRYNMAAALEEAKKAAEARRFDEAQEVIRRAVTVSHISPSAGSAQVMKMMSECEDMKSEMTASRYDRGGSQAVTSCFSRQYAQRCNDASDEGMYQNEWKRQMKSKKK